MRKWRNESSANLSVSVESQERKILLSKLEVEYQDYIGKNEGLFITQFQSMLHNFYMYSLNTKLNLV
jgi:hypothetical protein